MLSLLLMNYRRTSFIEMLPIYSPKQNANVRYTTFKTYYLLTMANFGLDYFFEENKE